MPSAWPLWDTHSHKAKQVTLSMVRSSTSNLHVVFWLFHQQQGMRSSAAYFGSYFGWHLFVAVCKTTWVLVWHLLCFHLAQFEWHFFFFGCYSGHHCLFWLSFYFDLFPLRLSRLPKCDQKSTVFKNQCKTSHESLISIAKCQVFVQPNVTHNINRSQPSPKSLNVPKKHI